MRITVIATLATLAIVASVIGTAYAEVWTCAPGQSLKACKRDLKEACAIQGIKPSACKAKIER